MSWKCQAHARRYLNHESLERLLPGWRLRSDLRKFSGLVSASRVATDCKQSYDRVMVGTGEAWTLMPPWSPSAVMNGMQLQFSRKVDLTSDSIDEWIQLLSKVETPRLQSLSIQGSEHVEQTFAHSSILFAEQCIRASLLALSFGHVQLQDRFDWARIVESMDLSPVVWGFSVGGRSRAQFVGTPEAMQLEQEKRTQWESMK